MVPGLRHRAWHPIYRTAHYEQRSLSMALRLIPGPTLNPQLLNITRMTQGK